MPSVSAGGPAIATISLWDGAVGGGTKIAGTQYKMQDSGDSKPFQVGISATPSAGAKTYNVSMSTTTNNVQTNPAATTPAWFLVKLI